MAVAGTADRLDERLLVPGRLDEEADETAYGAGRRCPPDDLQVPRQHRIEWPDHESLDPQVVGGPEDADGDARAPGDGAQHRRRGVEQVGLDDDLAAGGALGEQVVDRVVPDPGERWPGKHDQHLAGERSEERRVGKECRSRWSPDHSKKNKVTLAGNVRSTDRVIYYASSARYTLCA